MPRVPNVNKLPDEILIWLNNKLVVSGFGQYEDISAELLNKGYEVSKSALHRHGQKLKEQLESSSNNESDLTRAICILAATLSDSNSVLETANQYLNWVRFHKIDTPI